MKSAGAAPMSTVSSPTRPETTPEAHRKELALAFVIEPPCGQFRSLVQSSPSIVNVNGCSNASVVYVPAGMAQGSNSLAQSPPSPPASEAAGAPVATLALAEAAGALLGDAARDADGTTLSAGLAQPTIAAVTTSAPRMRIVRALMGLLQA